MTALGALEHFDAVEDIRSRILTGCIDSSADAFVLELLAEVFGHSEALAVATPAHAADQVVIAQKGLLLVAGELGGFNRSAQHPPS